MIRVNASKNYQSFFNTDTGVYVRKQDPFVCPAPELLDISITNKCTRSCSFCYMNSSPCGDRFLSMEDLELVLKQCPSVFQIALGGGEPTIHPQFVDILRKIWEYKIRPNYTTNGDNLTPEILKASKECCGAVAVSVYDMPQVLEATEKLIGSGIKTNWHWVVSKSSIERIIEHLNTFTPPKGLNAIIFLLHKPVGRGTDSNSLTLSDPIDDLFDVINRSGVKGGFDACFMNFLIRYKGDKLKQELVDFCDAARYTAYIDWDLNVKPCSFNRELFGNLRDWTMKEIWNGAFEDYRNRIRESACKGKCDKFSQCYSGCPILPINLCQDLPGMVQPVR